MIVDVEKEGAGTSIQKLERRCIIGDPAPELPAHGSLPATDSKALSQLIVITLAHVAPAFGQSHSA